MTSNNDDKLTLTVEEASKLIGVCKNNMLELVKREDFPAIKLKRKIIINKNQFIEWFNNLTNS